MVYSQFVRSFVRSTSTTTSSFLLEPISLHNMNHFFIINFIVLLLFISTVASMDPKIPDPTFTLVQQIHYELTPREQFDFIQTTALDFNQNRWIQLEEPS